MADKFRFSTRVTPKGIAKYAWLDKPDPFQEAKGKTEFKLRVLLDDNETTRAWVQEVLDTAAAEARKAGVKLKKVWASPFRMPEDQDEDDFVPQPGKDKPRLDADHQGRIFFEVKSGFPMALLSTKKDANGNLLPLDPGVKIMSGDIVKVKFILNPYEGVGSGLSLRGKAVQLIQKSSNFSAGVYSADEFGSDDEDSGDYETDEVQF